MFKVNQMYLKKKKNNPRCDVHTLPKNKLQKVYTCDLIFRGLSVLPPLRNVSSMGDL
jgi:hypothetical protein